MLDLRMTIDDAERRKENAVSKKRKRPVQNKALSKCRRQNVTASTTK
jgi:hypothetical protein